LEQAGRQMAMAKMDNKMIEMAMAKARHRMIEAGGQ